MTKKIILVDLDLTLLRSNQTISDFTISTLKKCQKAGNLVGFSTSRGTTRIKTYVQQVNPDIIICNAGASIFYNEQLLHQETFTLEQTHKLLNEVYNQLGDNAEITVDTLYDFFWNRNDNKSTQYGNDAKYNDCRNFPEPAMKFCVQTTDRQAAEKIASQVKGCTAIPFSDIPWYKFAPDTATKENAIKYISQYLKIGTEDIIAFGDDYSDIGMLKLCGKGIAMGNAIEPVKAIADDVTASCDEDGVALWLEKHHREFGFDNSDTETYHLK